MKRLKIIRKLFLTKTLTFDELVAQYVDYGGLGGTAFIGKPKQPTFVNSKEMNMNNNIIG